jgi:myosin-crossreactive antigen
VRNLHTSRSNQRLPRSSSVTQRREFQSHPGRLEDRELRELQFAAPANIGSTSSSEKKHIAILGGGITGLSAAHYLTRELPTAKITIYEASNRLGGWLHSKSVNVGNGNVVFESGPRTLRPHTPAGMATVEMVCSIGTQTSGLLLISHFVLLDRESEPHR